jgi:alkaline phosphatase D
VEQQDPRPDPRRPRARALDRRGFLVAAAAAAAAAAGGGLAARALLDGGAPEPAGTSPPVRIGGGAGVADAGSPPPPGPASPPEPPFTLGVASGDPLPGGVVLWTRLAPEPLDGGGMPGRPVEVHWRVAHDERMARVAASGTVLARPEDAHAVHVEVAGLEPDRWYFYRFRTGGPRPVASAVGRTRTAPAPSASVRRLRLALASCQDWQAGFWPAWAAVAEEDLDLVVHLGDYIYERGPRRLGGVRRHEGPEATTLAGYRNRHALYKTDPALQAAHAAFPFVVTFDDHEVVNGYAGDRPADRGDRPGFLARRAAAYRAYWEHLPLRRAARPRGPTIALARRLAFGDLADLHVLDTRQFRSEQPCGGELARRCEAAADPAATVLGAAQERWLAEGLAASRARWNVLAQQVMMAQLAGPALFGALYNTDQWDGYVAARARLLRLLAGRRVANPVVTSGDVHSAWVNDLKADFADPDSATVATELVCTSISSAPPRWLARAGDALLAANPHLRHLDASRRGYTRCELTPELLRADLRTVDSVRRRASPVRTSASFVVEDRRPGATRA